MSCSPSGNGARSITTFFPVIASVIFLYGRKLLDNKELLKKTMAAFIPTGILGFVLYKFVKNVLLGNVFVTLLSLAIGGLAIIILEKYFKHKDGGGDIKTLTYPSAIFIGLAQSLSMIPGVSRSAATILGAMGVGLNRQTAVEFSFILAIPTMLAATGYDLLKSFKDINSSNVLVLIFGFTVSFIVALAAVKWFLNFVKKYSLTSFGVYRIVLSIIYFLLIK